MPELAERKSSLELGHRSERARWQRLPERIPAQQWVESVASEPPLPSQSYFDPDLLWLMRYGSG